AVRRGADLSRCGSVAASLPRPGAVDPPRRDRVRARARARRSAHRAGSLWHRSRLASRPHEQRRAGDARARTLQRYGTRLHRRELAGGRHLVFLVAVLDDELVGRDVLEEAAELQYLRLELLLVDLLALELDRGLRDHVVG